MKQNFTKRILFFLFLVIPIPLILNLIALTVFSFSTAKDALLDNLHMQAARFNLEFEKKLSIQKVCLKRLANTLSLKAYANKENTLTYNELFSLPDDGFSLCLLSLIDGRIQTKNPNDPFVHYIQNHPKIKKKLTLFAGSSCLMTLPSHNEHYLVLIEEIEKWNAPTLSGLLIGFSPLHALQHDLLYPPHQEELCLLNKYGDVLLSSNPKFTTETFSLNIEELPKITPHTTPSVSIRKTPRLLRCPNLLMVTAHNTTYLGIFLNTHPIQGMYTLALVPMQAFLTTALKLPLQVLAFYILAFTLMGWILPKVNKRLNQPIQELTLCMESAWRGNHDIRYEPHPYGYEINELGNIFNCTLIRLLNSQEKAQIEYTSGRTLQNELAILDSLGEDLLTPPPPPLPNVTFLYSPLRGKNKSGYFHGWTTTTQALTAMIGMAGNVGLPSYLYALSARSLFLTYATLHTSLQEIILHTYSAFQETTQGYATTLSALFIRYCPHEHTLELQTIGENPPLLFLKRHHSFSQLHPPYIQEIHPNDILICLHGHPALKEEVETLPIAEIIQDPLSPLHTGSFPENLYHLLRKETSTSGVLACLTFS